MLELIVLFYRYCSAFKTVYKTKKQSISSTVYGLCVYEPTLVNNLLLRTSKLGK